MKFHLTRRGSKKIASDFHHVFVAFISVQLTTLTIKWKKSPIDDLFVRDVITKKLEHNVLHYYNHYHPLTSSGSEEITIQERAKPKRKKIPEVCRPRKESKGICHSCAKTISKSNVCVSHPRNYGRRLGGRIINPLPLHGMTGKNGSFSKQETFLETKGYYERSDHDEISWEKAPSPTTTRFDQEDPRHLLNGLKGHGSVRSLFREIVKPKYILAKPFRPFGIRDHMDFDELKPAQFVPMEKFPLWKKQFDARLKTSRYSKESTKFSRF